MTHREVTPWFPASTPPVRNGVYWIAFAGVPVHAGDLRRFTDGNWYQLNGFPSSFGLDKGDKWRGLV